MDEHDKDLLDLIDHPVFAIEANDAGAPVYSAFNARARAVIGLDEDEILGLTARELYPGRLGDIAYSHHSAAIADAQTRAYEILLPIQGSNRRIRTTLKPVLDSAGKVRRLIGSSVDVSSQQVFSEVKAGIDAISDEIQDFVHLAAHDLSAPIRQVEMIASLLREDFNDMGDGKLDLIDLLEDVGTKAMSLIADVLSHAQATSTTSDVITFEFETLATEVMALLDPLAKCDCRIGRALITGDRAATLIILRNLIDNAIKYATEGGGTDKLQLSLAVDGLPGGFFQVTVRDNGNGFSDPATIFLSGGALRASSGFGLLGVRRLINARGGTLTARNADDEPGAEIAFILPGSVNETIAIAAPGADPAAIAPAEAPASG